MPTTKWINPSDCVDMDCDARRKVCVKDVDGTYLGPSNTTLVSKSEYHWDGDRRWGLGKRLNSYLITTSFIFRSDIKEMFFCYAITGRDSFT